MKILKWIVSYIAAILIGSIFMMTMHHLSGIMFPEAALAKFPENNPEALRAFISSMGLGPQIAALISHWLGTAMGAFIAMRFAPVTDNWLRTQSILKATFPGWAIGIWFTIGGVANAMMIPMPSWMIAIDLIGYVPFAFLVSRMVVRSRLR
jgi:hypothetical protein